VPAASARSQRGLDWLAFFLADVQTGFGPFISVYLTAQHWTQVEIGLALSIGTVTSMLAQVPAGALVDRIASKRRIAQAAILAIAASALLLAGLPQRLPVSLAEVLHAVASCILVPALAAISLAMAGLDGMGERLGRNARFASIGNGVAAALLGACGYYLSERAVFLLTAALVLPALAALRRIEPADLRAAPRPPRPGPAGAPAAETLRALFLDRRVLSLAACAALFHLANAAMLPLVAGEVTRRAPSPATLIIAACIVAPQLVVAAISPWVGRQAAVWGRRPILLLGFAAVPARGLLLALITSPWLAVAVQLLDGVSAAAFGVLVPLVAADLTRGSGRFNLLLGAIGLAVGLGATVSTTMAGAVFDDFGRRAAFLCLAASGAAATALVALALPETRRRGPGAT
jgi:MFS family permease